MEVAMPPTPTSPDFHFGISATAPSSPRRFGEPFNHSFHYTSAPTSPNRAASIFSTFSTYHDNEFAFDSGRLSATNPLPEISTADELFDNGRIRPLHLSPLPAERGRKRGSFISTTAYENRARVSRSLSPLRDQNQAEASTLLPKSDSGGRKWRLMDLLLFRSASEGRATGRESRDPLRNRTLFSSLFSSNGSSSSSSAANGKRGGKEESVNGAGVRRGGRRQVASAHEKHYTANRVAAEGQRKKTPLPYQRQGFFGFIQYNPAIRSITEGFGGNCSRP
ncbi:uncharacterized protein LOC110028969 [Phalaenopsis equestris]|uniref:uncharacterized protein LOC110028969 n=1 Tax=Phalaenopsis equestris TaxID=78828 RepID=UPI0009E2719F|nr:uncharacterized protein LOC110028969 [Phalaenopsis equestris]